MTTARQIAVVLLVLLGMTLRAAPVAAQSTSSESGRVTPDGPYQSQMRIVDPDAPPAVAAPRDDAFGVALSARTAGYLAARDGDTSAAIENLDAALATGTLAPLAQHALRRDILVLAARQDDDAAYLAAWQRYATPDATASAPELNAAAAAAAARSGQFELALRAVDLALAAPEPPDAWRQLKIAVLARLARYDEAATLAATSLDTSSQNEDRWRELIALMRAAGRTHDATAVAELAYEQGVLPAWSDVALLSQLYLATGLPDHAVVVLEATVAQSDEPPSPEALRLLATAQHAAGDVKSALGSARRLAAGDPTPQHWAYVAQLAQSLDDFDTAADALTRALRRAAPGDRGRWLLQMGQIQLARGKLRAARRAFEEASELGGVYRDALAALASMDARAALARSAAGPASDSQMPELFAAAEPAATDSPADTPAQASARKVAPLQRKTVPRSRFYHASDQADVTTLDRTVLSLAGRVARSLRRERLVAAGPLRFRVADAAGLAGGSEVEIQVGVPVRSGVPPRGGLRNITLPALDCVYRVIDGDASALAEAWGQLVRDSIEAGYRPGNDARTLVLSRAADGQPTRFELQLGLAPEPVSGQRLDVANQPVKIAAHAVPKFNDQDQQR